MNNNRKILLIRNSLPIRGAFGEVSVRFPDHSSAQRSVHLPFWSHRLTWGELLGETTLRVSSAHIHTQAAAVQPYGACKASDVSPTIAPTLANLDLLLELGAWSNLDTCAQIPRSQPINPKTSAPLCPGARPGDAPSPRSHLEGDSTRDTAPVQPVRREQGLTRPLAAWRLGTRVTDAR